MLVRGKLEKDGGAISVVGWQFKELQVSDLVHQSRDFR
jgi:hypothetical protein